MDKIRVCKGFSLIELLATQLLGFIYLVKVTDERYILPASRSCIFRHLFVPAFINYH